MDKGKGLVQSKNKALIISSAKTECSEVHFTFKDGYFFQNVQKSFYANSWKKIKKIINLPICELQEKFAPGKSADISQNICLYGLFQNLKKTCMGFSYFLEVLQEHTVLYYRQRKLKVKIWYSVRRCIS